MCATTDQGIPCLQRVAILRYQMCGRNQKCVDRTSDMWSHSKEWWQQFHLYSYTFKLCGPPNWTCGRTSNCADRTSPPYNMYCSINFCLSALVLELTPAAVCCKNWFDHMVGVIHQRGGVNIPEDKERLPYPSAIKELYQKGNIYSRSSCGGRWIQFLCPICESIRG